jgi:prepilin-type N-terminal cleavage/methylation domain-containing protein
MRDARTSTRGLTLLEVLAALLIIGAAMGAFMRTVRPTIAANKANRKYVDLTGALSEVLDSAMTQPISVLDGMNGGTYNSRQGVPVKLTVATMTQSGADALMPGIDVSRLRKLSVKAVADSSRVISVTVSNYQDVATGKCYTN